MGNSLNKSQVLNLRNKSGVAVNQGDSVIFDNTTQESFTVTGSAALANTLIGVVLDQAGIANNGNGLICFEGYVPKVNLTSFGSIRDSIGLSSTSKTAVPHTLIQPGDFGQILGTGTSPSAYIWGFPIQANTGSSGSMVADYQQTDYHGGVIGLALTGTGWVDVPNSTISFTPSTAGKYKVTYTFPHYFNATVADVFFRITDGVTNTQVIENYKRHSSGASDQTMMTVMTHIFSWTASAQTIKLQYKNQSMTTVITHDIESTNTDGLAIWMEVYRIGS